MHHNSNWSISLFLSSPFVCNLHNFPFIICSFFSRLWHFNSNRKHSICISFSHSIRQLNRMPQRLEMKLKKILRCYGWCRVSSIEFIDVNICWEMRMHAKKNGKSLYFNIQIGFTVSRTGKPLKLFEIPVVFNSIVWENIYMSVRRENRVKHKL